MEAAAAAAAVDLLLKFRRNALCLEAMQGSRSYSSDSYNLLKGEEKKKRGTGRQVSRKNSRSKRATERHRRKMVAC